MSTSQSPDRSVSGLPPLARAALWMIGSITSFTSMAVAGRFVSYELDTFELMLYRSLVGVVVVITVASLTGSIRQVTRRNMGTHLVRNVAHFTGQNLWFYALATIPMAQVFALEFTAPLWALVLAALFLGERITRVRVIAAALGFTGILIVTQPFSADLGPGTIAAALCAIGFGATGVFTRKLTRTETVTCILFWLTIMQAVFGLVCAGIDGDIALPSATTAPYLVLIGMAGLVAHFCLTKALSLAPAAVVMPIDFTRLPVIAAIGLIFYGEPLGAGLLAGAALILAGNFVNLRAEARR